MPIEHLLVSLITIWVSAKLLGELAERLRMPAVLGELVAGLIIGQHALGLVPDHEFIRLLAEIGVLLLLFETGLETDLTALLRVGGKSVAVAVLGIALPMAGGYLLALLFHLPGQTALLIGAALSATSIAIASRTLSDLGEMASREAQIVIGAAVLDDLLGLVILGVITALVGGQSVNALFVGLSIGKAVGFLALALVVGVLLAKPLLRAVDTMSVRGSLVTAALALGLGFAVLAQKAGVAGIIGAFAAGLALARTHRAKLIEGRLRPIASIFIPIFFVTIGAELDLAALNPLVPENRGTLLLAGGMVVVALVGKLLSGFAAWGKGVRRLMIGVAMAPRGEVVLVFAQIGLAAGILSTPHFTVLIITVFATAVAAPLLLGALLRPAASATAPPGRTDMNRSWPFLEPVDGPRRAEVYAAVAEMSVPQASYYLMVALSGVIASYGLLANSTAVVIGAMLVAPLMGPIFGIALGLVAADRRLLWHAIEAEAVGVLLAVLLALLLGLAPLRPLMTPEILSRTQPTLFDLLIALASGLAGAYALVDRRISPALPGVAVATALMPPLASCGLCLATGRWSQAFGALMLFVANFLAIQLVTAFVFVLTGFAGRETAHGAVAKGFMRRFGLSLVALALVAVYVTGTLQGLIADRRRRYYLQKHIAADVASTAGASISDIKHSLSKGQLEVMATVLTPQEISAEQVSEMQRSLQAGLVQSVHLVVRSLISRDADERGPVFVPQDEQQRQATAQEQADTRSRTLDVLRRGLTPVTGAELVDLQRSLEGAHPLLTAVVRTPVPLAPELVASLQGDLRRALGEPVSLVVRSVIVREATAEGCVNGSAPPPPNAELHARLQEALPRRLAATVPGAELVGLTEQQYSGRWRVALRVRTPRTFTPAEVRALQGTLRWYLNPRITLSVQCLVGAAVTAEGYTKLPAEAWAAPTPTDAQP